MIHNEIYYLLAFYSLLICNLKMNKAVTLICKMKKICILILLLFSINLLQAQFGPQQIISTGAMFPRKVAVGDMDGNGTLDVLSAARVTNELAWYSNESGIGDFGPLRLISESSENNAIVTGDIDGDGDLDIASSSADGDIFFWQENTDGLGNFGSQQLIDTINGAFDINLSDIDNDGDLDILGGSFETNTLYLYKNDGVGNFENAMFIGDANGRSIKTSDIDGDNDLDIIVSTTGNIIVGWYENIDGLGNFGGLQAIGSSNLFTSSISNFPIDIDGDGDIDILSVSLNDTIGFNWYENLDGLGNFSERNLISNNENNIWATYGADLDNDGDTDVLTASPGDNEIAWYENLDGLGNFGPQQTITTNAISARHVIAADIDNDGDMDVISASQNDSKIAWYENDPKFVGFSTPDLSIIHLTPNPTTGKLFLLNAENLNDSVWVKLYSITGNLLISKEIELPEIDMSAFTSGIYFVELTSVNQRMVKKIIKKT
jgi:hypothetical protein